MGNFKFRFFVLNILLLIVFLGLTSIIFKFKGIKFLLELLAVAILFLIAFIALIPAYSGSRGGWYFLCGVFFLVLLNLLIIYARAGMLSRIYLLTSLSAALGFVLSAASIKKEEGECCAKYEKPAEEEKKEEVYTNFEPGKYVASRTGTTYHIPRCDWAAKINKKNQVWFNDEKEAKQQKLKPHSCIE